MDETVVKFYRKLLRSGFEYTGELENPSIFLDTVGENLPICANIGKDFIRLYINVIEDRIVDIKYLCTCDPMANVAVEVLCSLAQGKTIAEAAAIKEEDFTRITGCQADDFLKRARGLLTLLNRGLDGYQAKTLA